MLEKAIEIEGLLRIIRDGKPLPETYLLLKTKSTELAGLSEKLEIPEAEAPAASRRADFVMEGPTARADMPKVVFDKPEEETEGEHETQHADLQAAMANVEIVIAKNEPDLSHIDLTRIEAEAADTEIDLTEEDDILLSLDDAEDTAPLEAAASAPAETILQTIEIIHPSGEDDTEEDDTEEEQEEPTGEGEAEEYETEPEPIKTVSINLKTGVTAIKPRKLKSAFSLNDRFLYSRELFGGNMKQFDSTLEQIEGIDDYSLIEEYFYNELEWSHEDPSASAFMEILRQQFT